MREFQQAEGLEVSARIDAATLAALGLPGQQSASAGAGAQTAAARAAIGAGEDKSVQFKRDALGRGAFERADRNQDGTLDRQEFQQAVKMR